MPVPDTQALLTVRGAVRALYDYAKGNPTDTALDAVTRTVKFRVRTDELLKRELNRHFDVGDRFRRKVAAELERMFDTNPDEFFAMVEATPKAPYQDKTSCGGWLDTKFGTEGENSDTPRLMSRAVLAELSANLKSFATRRGNVTTDIKGTLKSNAEKWAKDVPALVKEFGLSDVPPPPPSITEDRPTDSEIKDYNDWVALARMWCNLVLIQKHKLTRDEAAMPRYLKHFPSFPCSQKFRDRVELSEALIAVREATAVIIERSLSLYATVSEDGWNTILDRFPAPLKDREGPRNSRATTGRRLHALIERNQQMTKEQVAREITDGLFRAADKIAKHFGSNSTNDRQATVKLLNLYNTAAVFALEPLRVRGDYARLFAEDTPRRDAYGEARGAMHDASDTSEALQIAGFSVKDNGTANYNGFLAYRNNTMGDDWVFAAQLAGGNSMRVAPVTVKDPRRDVTEWTAFATVGGSRKKAQYKPKEVFRSRLWISKKEPPLFLPLMLGVRQGREYLWHFDRGLKDKEGWTLANARVLRIAPSGRCDLAKFFVVVTMQRELPHMAEPPKGKLIGVDRGEAVPAAFAVLDDVGRVLDRGKIHPEYREQQRKFGAEKSRMQSRYGGYSRELKAKERNRATALAGQVSRELLSLAATHQAPLVFERLNSALATRGGARQQMSLMQYERMITTVEQRMAEAACYKVPRQAKFRAARCGFLMFVGPAYTSATCSKCGHVHSNRFYDALAATLAPDKSGRWCVEFEDKALPLAESYRVWIKGKGEIEVNTAERLNEVMGERTFAKLPKTKAAAAMRVLKNALAYRPTQDHFRCLRCGHEDEADLQAAVNIARKSMFAAENPKLAKGEGEEGRRAIEQKWQTWYESKCKTWS
jgi:transposase